ncbi:MAG: hypothetical protein ABSD98_03510 [Candidatus Korobacteraceae bacterium]|jgi:hypothetical protein
MDLLDHEFVGEGRTLRLKARISDGWIRHPQTYCYSEQTFVDWKFDHKLRVQLSVFPRPGGLTDELRQLPALHMPQKGPCGIGCSLPGEILTVDVEMLVKGRQGLPLLPDGNTLNFLLPWGRTSNDKLSIRYVDEQFAHSTARNYELQLQIVFQPSPVRYPVYIDWERRFFPGGLPTLGKRR